MLSMKDCLDYCDLTEDEVLLIAEHEDIPDVAAAQLCCGLVQTAEGVLLLTQYMETLADRALQRGDTVRARKAMLVRERFILDHPVKH